MHVQSTDPSIAMHRVVCILLFVLCLVPVSEILASIGPLAEIHNKLKSSHSMRRGAGRGAGGGKPYAGLRSEKVAHIIGLQIRPL